MSTDGGECEIEIEVVKARRGGREQGLAFLPLYEVESELEDVRQQ